MIEDRPNSETLLRILFQQALEQVSRLDRDVIFERVFSIHNYILKILHIASFEGDGSVEHCEKYDTGTPKID